MHGGVGQDEEGAAEDAEADGVEPHVRVLEAEGAEDGGAGHLNVDAVLVVAEPQRADFVDDHALEAVVENGELAELVQIRRGKRDEPSATTAQSPGCSRG